MVIHHTPLEIARPWKLVEDRTITRYRNVTRIEADGTYRTVPERTIFEVQARVRTIDREADYDEISLCFAQMEEDLWRAGFDSTQRALSYQPSQMPLRAEDDAESVASLEQWKKQYLDWKIDLTIEEGFDRFVNRVAWLYKGHIAGHNNGRIRAEKVEESAPSLRYKAETGSSKSSLVGKDV